MQPDVNKYLPMLEGLDLSKEKKIDLIHDLWRIMEVFVDRAFGIHSAHEFGEENSKSNLQDSANLLESSNNQDQNCSPPEGGSEYDSSA